MKVILVTGANKGIGLAIVKKLLGDYPDTHVLLGSRDEGRGKAALETIDDKVKSRVEMIQLDVTSDESVQNAVKTFVSKFGENDALYGLINNAGGFSDSARATLELNTYGLRRVCEAFLPLLSKDKGRIVQISSAAGPMFVAKCSPKIQAFIVDKNITWKAVENSIIAPYLKLAEDATMDAGQKTAALADIGLSESGMGAYGVSKACVNAYTMELSRRFPNLLINSCTPGFIETDLTRPMAERSGKTPEEMGMLSAEKGTVAATYLMMGDLEKDISGYESGRYYGSDGVWSPLHKYRSPGAPPYDGSFP